MIPLVVWMALAPPVPAVADPCAPIPATGEGRSDRAAAALYRAVGDDEAAAGHVATATTAYRQALARDPGDRAARSALAALCRGGRDSGHAPSDTPPASPRVDFEEAVQRMERGDRAGAIAAFEAIRDAGPDPAAALLEGICEFELGREQRARALLDQARGSPGTAGTALFFLALIALHDGESQLASSLLVSAAAHDDRIAGSASGLLRLAQRDGRLALSALAEVGFDSNVLLAPDGTATPGGTGDGYGAGVLGIFLRPLGPAGPYARVTAQYRKQLEVTSYDLGDVAGAIGLRAGPRGRSVAGEYAYDIMSLGGSAYLSAHRLMATGRIAPGSWSVTGTYAARFESFLTSAASGFSGLRHDAQATVEHPIARALVLGVGYRLGQDQTQDAVFRFLEHGPVAVLWWGLGGKLRLLAETRLTIRDYDVVDPDFGLARADRYLDGSAAAELDLSERWTMRVGATGRRAWSNVAELRYSKLTTGVGLAYTMGAL